MKKQIIIGLAIISAAFIITIYFTIPNEDDFVQWFKENYNISCQDDACYQIEFKNDSWEVSEVTKYWNEEGYYENFTGFFGMGMSIKRLYRKADDPSQYFSIEAKGFMGDFEVIETEQANTDFFNN